MNKSTPDIALIFSNTAAVAAGTFTTNKVKAAPVRVSRLHLRSPDVRAIVANAGNANACTGVPGLETREAHVRRRQRARSICARQQVMVCSTGRIGVPLPIEKMEASHSQNRCRSV